MSTDRSERLRAIRDVSRRDRADSALAREIGAREVEPTSVARCPHGRGPARTCSQCVGVRVERLPFAASGGRTMPERYIISCRRGARSRWHSPVASTRRPRALVPADHYIARDVAQLAGVSEQTIRNHVERGTLVARRVDGRVFITRASVEQWLATRGQALPTSVDTGATGAQGEPATGPDALHETRAGVDDFPPEAP